MTVHCRLCRRWCLHLQDHHRCGLSLRLETDLSSEQNLTPEQLSDPRFAFRVFMVHKTANRSPNADLAVEIIQPGSSMAKRINMALKEVEKKKYLPTAIVQAMNDEGFNRFTMDSHTRLWKRLAAKDPAKGYGAIAVGNQWCWYDTWLNRVRQECQQHADLYKSDQAILTEQL